MNMKINEAKTILKNAGYICEKKEEKVADVIIKALTEDRMNENYNFYRNPYYQMNRKRKEKSELIKKELIEKIMDATDEYDAEELKSKNIRELKIILNNL